MKRHIKIITDGSCDLPKEVIERVNPGIIGINVCFGEESYIGGVEIDDKTFYEKMKVSKELPKTSSPSPDRFIEALKAAVQQGVTEIIPVISERTQFRSINQQRLTKCIIESVEQSEGFVIPVLRLPVNLKEFCNISGVDQIIFANEEESGEVKISSIKKFEENIAILVGPEGGFSSNEKEKLISNPKIISVSLGNRVLRSEVAAISIVACVNLIRE